MTDKDIARAWKDDEYRQKLAAQGKAVPENPAGSEELSDEDLAHVAGGLPMSHAHGGGFTGPAEGDNCTHFNGQGSYALNALECDLYPVPPPFPN